MSRGPAAGTYLVMALAIGGCLSGEDKAAVEPPVEEGVAPVEATEPHGAQTLLHASGPDWFVGSQGQKEADIAEALEKLALARQLSLEVCPPEALEDDGVLRETLQRRAEILVEWLDRELAKAPMHSVASAFATALVEAPWVRDEVKRADIARAIGATL